MEKDELNPILLAYLGDAVLELMVRERLICRHPDSAACNRAALSYVTAEKQAAAARLLRERFTPAEEEIFLRARNAKPHSVPHHAEPYEYRLATGLEAVFAWLYRRGEKDRMDELFQVAFPDLI